MADIRYFKDILDSDRRAGELAAHEGPIVGTLCNFSPEEIIVAAGGVPLRLCGGDHESAAGVEASLLERKSDRSPSLELGQVGALLERARHEVEDGIRHCRTPLRPSSERRPPNSTRNGFLGA